MAPAAVGGERRRRRRADPERPQGTGKGPGRQVWGLGGGKESSPGSARLGGRVGVPAPAAGAEATLARGAGGGRGPGLPTRRCAAASAGARSVAGVCTDPSSRRTRAGQLPGPTESGGRVGWVGLGGPMPRFRTERGGARSSVGSGPPRRPGSPGRLWAGAEPAGPMPRPGPRSPGQRAALGRLLGQGGARRAHRARRPRPRGGGGRCGSAGRADGRAGGALREGAVGPPPAGARAQPRGRSADR